METLKIIYNRTAAKTNEATVPTAKNDKEFDPLPLVVLLVVAPDELELDEPPEEADFVLLLFALDEVEEAAPEEAEEEEEEADELVTASEAIPLEMVATETQLELDGVE